MRTSLVLLTAVPVLALGCSESPDVVQASAPAAPEAAPENGGLEPVTNWKSERKRIAMLGLAYDSGRAVPVPEEADEVLAGLDAGDVGRFVAEGRAALEVNDALAAIPAFTRAALLDPGPAERWLDLGKALRAFKLESQSRAAWETGLEANPDDVELLFHVADMDARLGDTERAIELFERAVELDPGHGGAWGRLARIHYYANDDGAAWTAFHRAEDNGEPMPPQMRDLLASRTPEPLR